MWMLFKNSPVLWALLALSFFCLAITIEKIILFASLSSEKESFKLLDRVKAILSHPIDDHKISEARALCLGCSEKNICATLIRRVLDQHKQDTEWLADMISRERQMRLPYLEKRIYLLGTFSALAPLLGLLGTVLGIITAFSSFSETGEMRTLLLSQGIAQALITTAFGLFLAIPSLFLYNFFVNKLKKIDSYLSLISWGIISHIKKEKNFGKAEKKTGKTSRSKKNILDQED